LESFINIDDEFTIVCGAIKRVIMVVSSFAALNCAFSLRYVPITERRINVMHLREKTASI